MDVTVGWLVTPPSSAHFWFSRTSLISFDIQSLYNVTCFVTFLLFCFGGNGGEIISRNHLRKISYLDILYKVGLNILLEIWIHERLLGSGPHLGVCDEEGQHLGDVGHQTLQQGQGHRQEQGPGTNLNIHL